MTHYAILNDANKVINVIEWDSAEDYESPTGVPPVETDGTVIIGDVYDGSTFTRPEVVLTPEQIRDQAQNALDKSDIVAVRCVKAGVVFPTEWQTYVTALRAILLSGTGPLPTRPAYPSGT